MNILLADSDRDLLQSYGRLLTMDGHAVTTAFDGAQVSTLLGKNAYDMAILEETLPRIENEQLLELLARKGVPTLVLTNGHVSVAHLLRPVLPQAYLAFPFLPGDLTGTMENVLQKTKSRETLSCGGVTVDVGGFRFSGTDVRLTAGEIDLLAGLTAQKKPTGHGTRVLIQALNEKLGGLGSGTRIAYELEKGYRLVN